MRAKSWYFRLVLFLIICALSLPIFIGMWQYANENECVRQNQGLFDVTTCDFSTSNGLSLDGKWKFYWETFLHSHSPSHVPTPAYVVVPSQWHNLYFLQKAYPVEGYATYRAQVHLPPSQVGEELTIRVNSARVASRLFVNGDLIAQSGVPGSTRASEVPKNKPFNGTFIPNSSQVTVDIEISNFHHGASAGLNLSIVLGNEQQMQYLKFKNQAADWLMACFLLCMGLFFLGKWLIDVSFQADIWLAFLFFSVSLFVLTQSEKMLYDLFPLIQYETFVHIAGISALFGHMATFFYCYSLNPLYFRTWMIRVVLFSAMFLVSMVWIVDVSVFNIFTGFLFFFALIIQSFVISVFYRLWKQAEPGALFLFIAVMSGLMFSILWTSTLFFKLNPYSVPPVYVPLMVVMMAIGLSVQQKSIMKRLNETELAKLRHQIKPHFLFNALTTIIWASKRNGKQATQLLEHLSHFLRGNFDFDDRQSMVPLEKEFELIHAYLEIEKARFGERLQVEWQIDDESSVAQAEVPLLYIQTLVENAVSHGAAENEEGGVVRIDVRLDGDDLLVIITDNGPGFSERQLQLIEQAKFDEWPSSGSGIGLKNIHLQSIKLFQRKLEVANRDEGGAVVSVRIPLKPSIFLKRGKWN